MVEIKKTVRERVRSAGGKTPHTPLSHGVGRRKSSVARVWCYRGEGNVSVNGKEIAQYFDTHITRTSAIFPLTVVPHIAQTYDIKVLVNGGGKHAQADAIKLGISRAFVLAHEDIRTLLRQHDLLTVDSRLKERKKPGQPAARKKFQFVKR